MYRWSVIKMLFPWFILLAVTSCGTSSGDNDYAGGGIGGTGISVGKITAAGGTSVDVNGVAFDTTNATVTLDGAAGDQNNLKVGMIVKVDGTFHPDRTTGIAVNIDFKDILEGPVASVGSMDTVTNTVAIEVLGQTVIVDSSTYFDNFSDHDGNGTVDLTEFMNDIVAGNVVEVSGFVDADGIIYASYISLKSMTFEDYGSEIELKGIITALNEIPGTFIIGRLTIEFSLDTDFEHMTFDDLRDGLYVEVKGDGGFSDGVLIASKIELEDDGYHFEDNHEFKVEGYVTAILLTEGKFNLAGQTVRIIATTQYKDGSIVDIADIKVNMKLEVEGTVDALGVLVADSIKVESGDNGSEDDSEDDSSDSDDGSSDEDSEDSEDSEDEEDEEDDHDPS
ncbi:MAG TPA: DUF5666 domain-containing protein [Nitrospirota bacterium]|nr:DUF5666 domain-containing protein [Nitrospirota bacterium]